MTKFDETVIALSLLKIMGSVRAAKVFARLKGLPISDGRFGPGYKAFLETIKDRTLVGDTVVSRVRRNAADYAYFVEAMSHDGGTVKRLITDEVLVALGKDWVDKLEMAIAFDHFRHAETQTFYL